MVYVANVGDEDEAADGGGASGRFVQEVTAFAASEGASAVVISGQAEAELAEFDVEERAEMRAEMGLVARDTTVWSSGEGEGEGEGGAGGGSVGGGGGLDEDTLSTLLSCTKRALGLETYFTAGEKECRAWSVPKGATAPQAAGVIHTDFEKGFICGEVVAYADLDRLGGHKECKDEGLVAQVGKEYMMRDGDVCNWKFKS